MSTSSGEQVPEALAEPIPELVRVAGFLEQVGVDAQRGRRVGVPELARDVDRVVAQVDDQHRGEAVAEAMRVDLGAVGDLRPRDRGPDRARGRAVVAAAAGGLQKTRSASALKRLAIRCSRRTAARGNSRTVKRRALFPGEPFSRRVLS
jgi:hypothetical protein